VSIFILLSLPNYNVRLLIRCFLEIGDLMISSKDFINASLLFWSAVKTGNFTRDFSLQSISLQKLAKSLAALVYRKLALNCLFKALEFAYFYEDDTQELRCYEQLGKLYFEANELKMAVFYHRK
jgi:hypothetical protein